MVNKKGAATYCIPVQDCLMLSRICSFTKVSASEKGQALVAEPSMLELSIEPQ